MPEENLFRRDDDQATVCSPRVAEPLRILVLADAHLGLMDERDDAYREHAARMTRHSKDTDEVLAAALATATPERFDFVALLGDMLSYPSAAGVDALRKRMAECSLPCRYVAGNHDWHFEGTPGTSEDIRAAWLEKRLRPLYPAGTDPLMSSVEVKGVNLLFIDNSTYEITPGQLAFFRKEIAKGAPAALFVHVPLYVPGRPADFGCGHPEWGAAVDRHWRIEQRPRWPESGLSETALAFAREVFAAPNVLAVAAGHLHRSCADYYRNTAQWVLPALHAPDHGLRLTLQPMPARP